MVRLRQVIGNLVNNAIKFTETGGVLILIEPAAEGGVRVEIRDTGIGIAKDKIGKLFTAFTQADASTTRAASAAPGLGAGHAICKRLVDAMQGRLLVASTEGKGSMFGFEFAPKVLALADDWPDLDGAAVTVALDGIATRAAARRYLTRANAHVHAPGEPEAPPTSPAAGRRPKRWKRPRAARRRRSASASTATRKPAALRRSGQAQAVLVQVPFLPARAGGGAGRAGGRRAFERRAGGRCARRRRQPAEASPRRQVLVADDRRGEPRGGHGARWPGSASRPRSRSTANRRWPPRRREAFDLILMDGGMPVMDGYDAARAIRAAETAAGRARVPIVALTAEVLSAGANAWRSAGMDGVLHKPFTLAGLARTLADVIEPTHALSSAFERTDAGDAPAARATPTR